MTALGALPPNDLGPAVLQAMPLIEVEIGRRFGAFGATALHGRCILVSHILSRVLQQFGAPARVVTGTLNIDHGADIAGLDIRLHAWVRIGKRHLIDPTIVQAERERFPAPLANLGAALLVDIPIGIDMRQQSIRLRHSSGALLVYTPFDRRLHAKLCAMPDGDPKRWGDMARRVIEAMLDRASSVPFRAHLSGSQSSAVMGSSLTEQPP